MPGSTVNLYCLEETHVKNVRVSNVYVEQQANSHVTHNVITLHNGTTRNRLDLHFRGEGAECCQAGRMRHCRQTAACRQQYACCPPRNPHCTSHELYKYVLDNDATGAFAGRVLVEHGAQQTSSEMRNQNLCASRSPHVHAAHARNLCRRREVLAWLHRRTAQRWPCSSCASEASPSARPDCSCSRPLSRRSSMQHRP